MLKVLRKIINSAVSRIESSIMRFTRQSDHLSIQLDLTSKCNLHCDHCYRDESSLSKKDISLSQWIDILEQYERLRKKLGKKAHIILCGGEPLLFGELSSLLEWCERVWGSDLRISVLTNGTLVSENTLRKFHSLKPLFQVSIDGATEKTHDRVRGKGSFVASIDGIRRIHQAGFSVNILSVLSKRTADEIDDLFALAKTLPVKNMSFTRFIPLGRGSTLVQQQEDEPLFGNMLQLAFCKIVESSRKYSVPTNTDQPLFHLVDSSMGALGFHGDLGIVVSHDGQLKVSSRTPMIIGSILDGSLEEKYLSHPIMHKLRNFEIDGCKHCTHFSRCGGDRNAAFASTGSYFGKDPGCWFLQKGRIL